MSLVSGLRRSGPWIALVVALPALLWWILRTDDVLKVPLGVEQAAIITYGGPRLAVKPFRQGVAINLRIAQVSETPGARVYDVRYLVNREGEHDLVGYLAPEDGSALAGLPPFRVVGDPELSKELEVRVKETEEIGIEVGGHYVAKLVAAGVLWIVWLFLLLFWGRRRRPPPVPVRPPPTPAEQLLALLSALESGALDSAQKARLEMLLLRAWRAGLVPEGAPMAEALSAVARDGRLGGPLITLQRWTHRPSSGVPDAEIADIIRAGAAATEVRGP
ncbi:MAG: hypothetical protein ACO3ND_06610 [Opitutales bacterium]